MTVHLVDEGVDTGPVVAQAAVPVLPGDDEATLHARIQDVEQPLYVEAVGRLARGGWTVRGRTVQPVTAPTRRTRPVRRALVSVYDKTGLEELGRGLAAAGRRDRLDRLHRRPAARGRACR